MIKFLTIIRIIYMYGHRGGAPRLLATCRVKRSQKGCTAIKKRTSVNRVRFYFALFFYFIPN